EGAAGVKSDADLREPATSAGEENITVLPLNQTAGEARPEEPGEVRARFTDVRRFAAGGGSDILIARDAELNREGIIKEIRSAFVDIAGVRERFLKEAQLTAQLEHPNIIPLYAVGHRSQDGAPFIVMRYVRGPDLQQAIKAYHSNKETKDHAGMRLLLR